MMRYTLYILGWICSFCAFEACTVEERPGSLEEQVTEGIPVVIKLHFATERAGEQEVLTKGALTELAEYKVNDLFVFVFKQLADGTCAYETSGLFRYEELALAGEGAEKAVTSGNIEMEVTSGAKRIFAVANLGETKAYEASKTLDKITTLDDLESLSAVLASPEAPADRQNGLLLMSGSFGIDEASADGTLAGGKVTVDENGRFIVDGKYATGKVYLKRLDARVQFVVRSAAGIRFIPKGYRVANVPVYSYLFERPYSESGTDYDYAGTAAGDQAGEMYRHTKPENEYVNFDALSRDEQEVLNGGDFTFYMFENRKPALREITDYQERERQEKGAVAGSNKTSNGAYINAHRYATYIEMIGSYYESYEDADGSIKERTAEVKYTIHLGYLNRKASDFKCERNTAYTYNVTITGVDNIELEVTSSNDPEQKEPVENQPGAEGEVIKAKQFYFVDAHYVTDRIVFRKDNVSENASFRIKTPFDPDGRGDAAKDYKWVWFVRNGKKYSNKEIRQYVYSGLKISDGTSKGYDAHELTGNWENYPKSYATSFLLNKTAVKQGHAYYSMCVEEVIPAGWVYRNEYVPFPENTADRIDIKTLIKRLKDERNVPVSETSLYDANGNAVFTVFIDEYYYDTDPVTGAAHPHWSKFVNCDNREMHILCDTQYSQDQESSLTTSNFLISQKSIKTFYNTDESQATAWGIESTNEVIYGNSDSNGRLPIQNRQVISGDEISGNYYPSKTNGRYNMYKNIFGEKNRFAWDTYIDLSSNELKDNSGSNVYLLQQACLQRNRDLNGDGVIDNDEIRWYLPAVNQMTGLFLGKDALPLDVQLMPNGETVTWPSNGNGGDQGNHRKYHYTNSNNIQFWAEEGASIGTNDNNDGYWNYRCVRNLGIDYNEPRYDSAPTEKDEVTDYVKLAGDSNGVRFDLSVVNRNALRSVDDKGQPLAITDETSEYNRPYTGFIVAQDVCRDKYGYAIEISNKDIYNNRVVNPCPAGWRIPNMRELTLIQAYTDYFYPSVFSCTTSSLPYKKKANCVYKLSFSEYGVSNINLNTDTDLPVRCVKDVK